MRFATAREVIDEAFDRGVTVFDTADSYGAGWGERWLGRALATKRDQVMILTKCGQPTSITAKLVRRLAPNRGPWEGSPTGAGGGRFSAPYIRSAVMGSLRRLGTDYIDVFMLHSPPTEVVTSGAWIEEMSELRDAGLIRYIGVSARTPEDAATAIRDFGVDCIELEVNACTVSGARSTLALAAESGAAVVARQVLGSGLLLNTLADQLAETGTMAPKRDIAAALIQTVLGVQEVSVALVGMSSVEHIEWSTSPPELTARFISQVRDIARNACVDRRTVAERQ